MVELLHVLPQIDTQDTGPYLKALVQAYPTIQDYVTDNVTYSESGQIVINQTIRNFCNWTDGIDNLQGLIESKESFMDRLFRIGTNLYKQSKIQLIVVYNSPSDKPITFPSSIIPK